MPSFRSFRSILLISALALLIQGDAAPTYVLDGKPITAEQYQAAQKVQESLKYFRAGNLQEALSKAEEAQKIAPDFYYVLGALGVTQARLGRSDEAIANLKRAYELKPDSADILWSLGATLQSAGRTDEALNRLNDFLTRFPKDPKVEQGRGLKTLLERQKNIVSKITEHSDKDYFAEATGQKLVRWADQALPIKLYIADAAKVPGYKPSYGEIFKQSLQEWQSASDNKISFQQVSNRSEAVLEVVWSNQQSDVTNPAEGGETRLVPNGQCLSAARIILLTNPPVTGLTMNDQVMHFVCLHEIGHALGLTGHSNSPGDIMYTSLPLNFEKLQLSSRDAATMKRLYQTAITAGPTNSNATNLTTLADIDTANDITASNDKAVTAMNQGNYTLAASILKAAVDRHPQSDVLRRNYAAALNNTGLQAMQQQQFEKAVEIFQQSLRLEPDSKTAQTNIGIVHYNQGLLLMKSGKPAAAEGILRTAATELKKAGNSDVLLKVNNLLEAVEKKQTKAAPPVGTSSQPEAK